jgi:hypothetical protein
LSRPWIIPTVLAMACLDRTVVDRAPCQARVYAYDVSIALDERGRGCIGPLPAGCRGQPPFDADPDTPGTQYDCSVADVQHYGLTNQVDQDLPPCDDNATNVPCWRAVRDQACSELAHDTLEVVRAMAAPQDSRTSVNCIACIADCHR